MYSIKKTISAILLTLFATLTSVQAMAQDKKVEIDLNVNKGNSWYANPVVWVIGGAVFILLLVALLRNSKSAN